MSLRNHTGSYSVPEEKYLKLTVGDYAEDVLKVLNWIDRPAILIGHSMGGITVQKVAEQKNLRALILLASVGPGQLGAIGFISYTKTGTWTFIQFNSTTICGGTISIF